MTQVQTTVVESLPPVTAESIAKAKAACWWERRIAEAKTPGLVIRDDGTPMRVHD